MPTRWTPFPNNKTHQKVKESTLNIDGIKPLCIKGARRRKIILFMNISC